MQNNLQRRVSMLSLIPRYPNKVTAPDIAIRLADMGYPVTTRSVQRDLKDMYDMGLFGVRLDDQSKPYGWSIEPCWRTLNLTLMDTHIALALMTLNRFGQQLLPGSSLNELRPYFERAEQVLGDDLENPWARWLQRIATDALPSGDLKNRFDPDVLNQLQDALLEKKQISCDIQRNLGGQKPWIHYSQINPQGIVIRFGLPMLVFTVGTLDSKNYVRPVLYIRHVQQLSTQSQLIDDLDVASAGKRFRGERVSFECLVEPGALLMERFNWNYDVEFSQIPQEDGRLLVTAVISNSAEFRQHLWESADHIEVLAPQSLKNYLYKRLKNALRSFTP